MKKTTTNLAKASEWISDALKSEKSRYFRFVDYVGGECVYGAWLTPEIAHREMKKHDEWNTLSVQMITIY